MITEEIKSKAKDFALFALQGQIEMITDAYIKGYEDAMKVIPHEPIQDGQDSFQDLMLESGTMWTTDLHGNSFNDIQAGYYEAFEYGLPTKEQYDELFAKCRRDKNVYVGKNSRSVKIINAKGFPSYTWVKSEVINDEALAYEWTYMTEPKLVRRYTGFKSYFHRVKNKSEV